MKGGFIFSPKDKRDYPICMAYDDVDNIEIPKNFTLPWQPPYEKQISSNCVAQTIANILEVMWYNITGRHENFSIGFIYGNRKKGQTRQEGMTGYMACENICEDGDILATGGEIHFENPGEVPSIIRKVEEFKTNNPEWKKYSFIPSSYIRTNSVKEVKKFILKYKIPVMAVCEVNKFWIGEGYHAMPLYKWQGNVATMQNSWGNDHKMRNVELPFDEIEEFWLILPFEVCNFSDLDTTHWAYNDIENCVAHGVMKGYPDNTIRPENNVTRAELCVMLYRMMKENV